MKREWKELSRGDTRAQWAGMYVTMNKLGTIVMNKAAYERLDEPQAVNILYDAANCTIGLRATGRNMRNAYPVGRSGRHGGRRIPAYRVITECGVVVKDTIEFTDPEIDTDGVLILNLRTAKVSNRALNHPKRKRN
ncbi:MAG: hypothetical protein KF881_10310 [Acidobacteria bacterium]|nr:hypothetical protein [Acidobacteriota bacterium]